MTMNELLVKLRDEAARNGGQGAYAWKARELCKKAADALEAAARENERLRTLMRGIVNHVIGGSSQDIDAVAEFCDHCGRRQLEALSSGSTHCAPPHISQPHSFTGKHPAERPNLGGIFT